MAIYPIVVLSKNRLIVLKFRKNVFHFCLSKLSPLKGVNTTGMLFNLLFCGLPVVSERFIKPKAGRILSPIEKLVVLNMNWRQESQIVNSADSAACDLCHMSPPSLCPHLSPASLPLILICQKHPLKISTMPNWGFSHDNGDMYVHDTATGKDRLPLTFASAVAIVAIATPSCWRRKGMEGTRVGGARRETEGGRRIINQCPHSVASPASDGEVNGVGRRLFSTVVKGSCCAVAMTLVFLSAFLFSLLI